MERLKIYAASLTLAVGLSACNNSASDADNASSDIHKSLSVAGDTIIKNTNGFSTAMHQMMNDMHQLPMSGNVDKDFAMMMRSHHQGAVSMSLFEISNGKDQTLKIMAQKISDEQKVEIKELEMFITSHEKTPDNYDPQKKDQGFAKVLDENMQMMMDMSKMDTSMSADQQFVAMMIPHHQSAVDMAKGFLKYGKDARLIAMAKEMIISQNKEIGTFNSWVDLHKE